MTLLQTLALAMSVSGAGQAGPPQTVLIDFYSDQCPPCRAMAPVIAQLEAAGYPVVKVNISQYPAYARQWKVSAVPTFIMVANGKQIGRISGLTTQQQLLGLYQQAGVQPGHNAIADNRQPVVRGQQPPRKRADLKAVPPTMPRDPFVGRNRESAPPQSKSPRSPVQNRRADMIAKAKAATVRIRIEETGGYSFGTGTIVDVKGEEALVLTCGHIFAEAGQRPKVQIDLFENNKVAATVPGQVIHFDEKNDVGMIAIRPGRRVEPIRVAPNGYSVNQGAWVFSVGCDRGAMPSVMESRVVALNRYDGPPNIEASGTPVVGRSGGGLFDAEGTLVGVCNCADPGANEGLYAGIPTIQQTLTSAKLAFIFQGDSSADTRLASSQAPVRQPQQPLVRGNNTPNAQPRTTELHDALMAMGDDAEVICIVRNRNDRSVPSRTVVIDKPSLAFMKMIAAGSNATQGPQPTGMHVPAK